MICYPLLGQNGRFGNQLFQIAATYSHAIDCNTEALFPEWEYKNLFKTPIKTYLNQPHIENEYTEKNFYFDPIPKLPNLAIKGYFQTEKYFKHNFEAISKLFTFKDELVENITNKYKEILKESPVGVQLRTYTHGTIDPRHIHCDVTENEEYLQKAFKYFGKDRLFFVVSDNFKYTESRLPKAKNIILIDSNSPIEDFILLNHATDFIVSASSFGWWGSYLSKSTSRRVLMPSKWFHVSGGWHDTRDIYPEGVIKL